MPARRNPEKALYTKTKWKRILAMRKANRDHRALIARLGGKCAWCEATWDDSHLQVDHTDGREHANHSAHTRGKRWDVRVKEYLKEHSEGVRLRVLCKECNSKDGRARQLAYEEAKRDCPF